MLDNLIAKFHDAKAKRENGEGGFTLIELLVVVVIIGVLVAIAIPLYLNYQQSAKEKSIKADVRNAVTAVQQCYGDNGNAMPTAGDFTSTGTALAGTGTPNPCATDKINFSTDTTKKVTLAVTGNTYTVTAGDGADLTKGTAFKFDSATGNITQVATP